MVIIKTDEQINKMRAGGKVLARILREVSAAARPGVVTKDLDKLSYDLAVKNKGKPSFLDYQGYPASLCVSLNEEVVHGIPSERRLKEGDIVSFDFGFFYKGLHTDAAVTVGVGKISDDANKLIATTKVALQHGIDKVREGNYTGDYAYAVQEYAERKNYGIVRELVGHGVGTTVHEAPQVPNFGQPRTGLLLQRGMTLALEPMVTIGDYRVKLADDKWTFVTRDKSLSAHMEHSVLVTPDGAEILTKE